MGATSPTAFLALWNDRSAARDDYEVWHTREHVPERLSAPGILAACRYEDGHGPFPAYFTSYLMADAGVFVSELYRGLVQHPTDWSRDMRPDLHRFLRVPCALDFRSGGGIAGCCITVPLIAWPPVELFDRLLSLPHVTALHGGMALADAAASSFPIETERDETLAGVLIVEGIRRAALVAEVSPVLAAFAEATAAHRATSYTLAFALRTCNAGDVRGIAQADARHLIRRS